MRSTGGCWTRGMPCRRGCSRRGRFMRACAAAVNAPLPWSKSRSNSQSMVGTNVFRLVFVQQLTLTLDHCSSCSPCTGTDWATPEGACCLTAALQRVLDQYRSIDILAARMRARDRAVMGRAGTADAATRPAITPAPSSRVRVDMRVHRQFVGCARCLCTVGWSCRSRSTIWSTVNDVGQRRDACCCVRAMAAACSPLVMMTACSPLQTLPQTQPPLPRWWTCHASVPCCWTLSGSMQPVRGCFCTVSNATLW